MNIKPFAVEEWMNAWEDGATYNIAETCVDSISLDELFALTGEDKEAFLNGPNCAAADLWRASPAHPRSRRASASCTAPWTPAHIVPHPRCGGREPSCVLYH